MVLLETFGLHLFKYSKIFGTHFGQKFPSPNSLVQEKVHGKFFHILFLFSCISGIRWFELKASPDILAYNLLVH